ncbi:MAG TPA: phosphate ABC transporter permease subunit PstC [Thermoleophilia bacterium]|nr:phosphate ABC transporter permease subunit PstC [Thermoleophilia bacterium]
MSTAEVEIGTPPGGAGAKAHVRRHHFSWGDPLFRWFTIACAAAVAVAMFVLIGVLVKNSWLAIHTNGVSPLTHVDWAPPDQFGALSSLFGTFVTTVIAMIIAVPLALAIALLLVELVHPVVSRVVGTTVEMLAAVPSIIFGLWGFLVIAPLMGNHVEPWIQTTWLGHLPIFSGTPFGDDILTAGLVLSLMILPFITAVSRDVLKMVPTVTKEAGYGMGSTTWEVTRKISMRYALSGIAGAVFLGLGRALGETMAVALIIGGLTTGIPHSLFSQGTTVSATIALNFGEAQSKLETSALIELALILFAITMVFQALAQVWLARARRMSGSRA